MRYKALALDLDGTLLNSREEVSARNLEALASAHAAGMHVILASARWYQLAQSVARQIESTAPVIACSGAQVRRLDDGHDIFDVRLPQEFADALYAICDAERTIATFVFDEHVMVKLDNAPDPSLAPPEMRFTTKLTGTVQQQPRIGLIQGGDICRIIEAELASAWSDQVHFMTSVSSRGKPILTLTAMGAHKGVALGVVCADLGIDASEVVAFGDSGNDIEMFRVAGASVAMGQASDELKAAATFVSAANDDDGVAVAIEQLLAGGALRGDALASSV